MNEDRDLRPEAAAGQGDDLHEAYVSGGLVWQGGFLRVARHVARLPDGRVASREFIHHPGAATIVPVLPDGRLLVERQFRYPVGRAFIEFPAGKIDAGEAPARTACRELEEETGWRAGRIAHLTSVHNAIGYSDERIEIFVAMDLVAGTQRLDPGEFVTVEPVTLDWLLQEILAGRVTDVKTQIGAFWLERLRDGRLAEPEWLQADGI